MEITPEQYLATANEWIRRQEEHIELAKFCGNQANRFLAHVEVPDDSYPRLRLIRSEE